MYNKSRVDNFASPRDEIESERKQAITNIREQLAIHGWLVRQSGKEDFFFLRSLA